MSSIGHSSPRTASTPTTPGEAPREGSLAKLDAYRQRWETWWAEATGFEGAFDTTLEDPRP